MLKESSNVLFLLPVPISETDINWSLPLHVLSQVAQIKCFIVENAKTARHFLKIVNPSVRFDDISMLEMDKHDINSQQNEIRELLKNNAVVGLMSEAGLPCIADPGNHIVRMAHELDIRVRPLSGPSSIVLALIASGLNGQEFRFNGYLPAKPDERKKAISTLAKEAASATQLFIEAPYRNEKILSDLINLLNPGLRLLVAMDITGENERIICKPVSWWKTQAFEIGKIPCLFGIGV
jgi:16S rRNA (cytidine1402-2'-O)-methyltransferase